VVLDQPVVVLGGGGFVGANLCNRLSEMGCDVTAVDVHFPEWRKPNARCVTADLTNLANTVRATAGAGLVFHLAADMGGVGYFHSDADLGASMRNGRITLNVAEAAIANDIERVFYASSACAYPTELQVFAGDPPKLHEELIGFGTPDALYGAEKLQGLRIMGKLGARVGILHTVFGPLQEHDGRRMKFPAAVATKALAARTSGKLELWGDGSQMRSYLYVDDAVERIITIAAADSYEGPVNVGSDGAVTCREVAEMCLRLSGADAEIVTNPAEPSGVLARDCSNEAYDRRYGPGPDRELWESFWLFMDWLEAL
jgi:GDP-D-mannose 3',5'-epimerase